MNYRRRFQYLEFVNTLERFTVDLHTFGNLRLGIRGAGAYSLAVVDDPSRYRRVLVR